MRFNKQRTYCALFCVHNDITYDITVKEYNQNNNETGWSESHTIIVEPHSYMAMNEYTELNYRY